MAQRNFTVLQGVSIESNDGTYVQDILIYNGDPEGNVTANVGSWCIDTTTGNLYTKKSGTGSSGWELFSSTGVGDWKDSMRVGTTTDATYWDVSGSAAADINTTSGVMTLTGLEAGTSAPIIDGVEVVVGDRILVKNMQNLSLVEENSGSTDITDEKKYNGLWEVASVVSTTSMTLTRTIDADEDSEITANLIVSVEEGNDNSGTAWIVETNDPITVGTTEVDFVKAFGTGLYVAGDGIDITNNVISADLAADGGLEIDGLGSIAINLDSTNDTLEINASNELVVKGYARNTITTTTGPDTLDSLAVTDYGIAKWFVYLDDGTNVAAYEVWATNDGGTNVDFTVYGKLKIGSLATNPTIDVDINTGNMRLLVTTASGITASAIRLAY